jgi:hypothetical protein
MFQTWANRIRPSKAPFGRGGDRLKWREHRRYQDVPYMVMTAHSLLRYLVMEDVVHKL